jgi:GAF domain-containing protein
MAKAAPRSMSSSSRDQTEVTRLTCELNAAIERQNATAEILASVSRSSTDTRPGFDAILDNVLRLFRTRFALVLLVRNGMFEVGGIKGDLSFDELAKHYPLPVDERLLPGKAVLAGRPMQLSPIVGNVEAPSNTQRMAIEFGFNAQISVPLIRDGEAIGALSAARRDAIAFTDEQVALIKSFAAQAVIAIENARLLNELRQSLEQQTATAQVLQVISRSTGELAQVFSTILANATRICEAKFGTLYLKEGDGFRATATHNAPPAYEEARAQVVHPSPHTTLWQAANTKRPVHIVDVTLEQGYSEGDPFVLSAVKLGGYRSVLSVPLLQEDEVVGVISIFRQEVSSFSDEHVSLLQNFAAQAVIAIENARLLSDLQERTKELSALNEQLEQRVGDQ